MRWNHLDKPQIDLIDHDQERILKSNTVVLLKVVQQFPDVLLQMHVNAIKTASGSKVIQFRNKTNTFDIQSQNDALNGALEEERFGDCHLKLPSTTVTADKSHLKKNQASLILALTGLRGHS